jgi:hypothetical protein
MGAAWQQTEMARYGEWRTFWKVCNRGIRGALYECHQVQAWYRGILGWASGRPHMWCVSDDPQDTIVGDFFYGRDLFDTEEEALRSIVSRCDDAMAQATITRDRCRERLDVLTETVPAHGWVGEG